jgi:hypothetical protein
VAIGGYWSAPSLLAWRSARPSVSGWNAIREATAALASL